MVRRAILTKEFVDSLSPPEKGEIWISDTKLKGFGLRLWSGKKGGSIAFSIRISDTDGKSIRRTFDPKYYRQAYRSLIERGILLPNPTPSPGDLANLAREWALNEINLIKKRDLSKEKKNRIKRKASRSHRITLGKAADSIIKGMRFNGRSLSYVDRIDKIFSVYVPTTYKNKPLYKLSPRSAAKILTNKDLPVGNIRILKSFLSQVYRASHDFFGAPFLGDFSKKLSEEFWKRWDRHDVTFPQLNSLKPSDYERVFSILESEEEYWQQALCIRLFFEFGAPLSRLMSAQWAQIYNEDWFPYYPAEKVYWFESKERISPKAQDILLHIRTLLKRDFGESLYWFPSKHGRQVEYIRSVDTVWRNTLRNVGSRYYPLRHFAMSHRHLNSPSYARDFLNYYGELFRQQGNAAELSRILGKRKGLINNSDI